MKTFLAKDKKPIVKWGSLKDNTFFKGEVPKGFSLCVSPSKPYIIVDIDNHEGKKNGFDFIPKHIKKELDKTFNYKTKNKGQHYWLKYTGNKPLGNKSSKIGIDLRTEKGYVIWYPDITIKKALKKVNKSSKSMNLWLEEHFSYI